MVNVLCYGALSIGVRLNLVPSSCDSVAVPGELEPRTSCDAEDTARLDSIVVLTASRSSKKESQTPERRAKCLLYSLYNISWSKCAIYQRRRSMMDIAMPCSLALGSDPLDPKQLGVASPLVAHAAACHVPRPPATRHASPFTTPQCSISAHVSLAFPSS